MVEILSDSLQKMENIIFEIMIDLVFHYINVNIVFFCIYRGLCETIDLF